jgi:hypothetical protein
MVPGIATNKTGNSRECTTGAEYGEELKEV